MVAVGVVKPEDERAADVIELEVASLLKSCGRTPKELYVDQALFDRVKTELAASSTSAIPGIKYRLDIFVRPEMASDTFMLDTGEARPKTSFSGWFGPSR